MTDRPMNVEMQKKILSQRLEEEGISADTVDLEAEIDPTLRYNENERNILAKYGNQSEEQMFQNSMGGAITGDIEKLKNRMVTKENLEEAVERRFNKLQEKQAEKQAQQISQPVQETQPPATNTASNEPENYQFGVEDILGGAKQKLTPAGKFVKKEIGEYKKYRKGITDIQKAEKQSYEKGRIKGYYNAGQRSVNPKYSKKGSEQRQAFRQPYQPNWNLFGSSNTNFNALGSGQNYAKTKQKQQSFSFIGGNNNTSLLSMGGRTSQKNKPQSINFFDRGNSNPNLLSMGSKQKGNTSMNFFGGKPNYNLIGNGKKKKGLRLI